MYRPLATALPPKVKRTRIRFALSWNCLKRVGEGDWDVEVDVECDFEVGDGCVMVGFEADGADDEYDEDLYTATIRLIVVGRCSVLELKTAEKGFGGIIL